VKRLRFLVASGPTREPLDPVRYLSNYSTGVMGNELAKAVKARGHRLTWVRCPDDAESARELLKRLEKELPKHDVLVMAAAVCDARPVEKSAVKIKKAKLRVIKLVENPDILATLARKKKKSQIFIGFALESEKFLENGFDKVIRKKLEAILVQRVADGVIPFGKRNLDAILIRRDSSLETLRSVTKTRVAALLVKEAEKAAEKA
jgi:phosphopantothenoylcysteine decarboxylase/phosphopantothenate--cysteine ligase